MMETWTTADTIEAELKQIKKYATTGYLCRKLCLNREIVETILENDKRFMKSLMSYSEIGCDNMWTLRAWFSRIKDIWETFKYMNYSKNQ